MCNQNEWIVREAFLAYDRGDIARMMDFVDPELDWTYLDPALPEPRPQTCHGRDELKRRCSGRPSSGCVASLRRSSRLVTACCW